MKSGMLAAEALYLEINAAPQPEESLVGDLGSAPVEVRATSPLHLVPYGTRGLSVIISLCMINPAKLLY